LKAVFIHGLVASSFVTLAMRVSPLLLIVLVAVLGTVFGGTAAIAQSSGAELLKTPRLVALGTLVSAPNKTLDRVLITDSRALSGKKKTVTSSVALRADLPFDVSDDGRFVVGFRDTETKSDIDLLVISVSTAMTARRITRLTGNTPVDAVWVQSGGQLVGMFGRQQFTLFESDRGESTVSRVLQLPGTRFLPSQRGGLLLLTEETGRLKVVSTRTRTALPSVSSAIERGVQAWLVNRGMRLQEGGNEGPFIHPVIPLQLSADDRILTVSLGENANTFLNFCLATGELVSSINLDKRVNASPAISSDGRLFAVKISPNSDDVAFQRPRSAYGVHIYESFSGNRMQTIPLSNAEWSLFKKNGAAAFLDEQSARMSFMPGNRALSQLSADQPSPKIQRIPEFKSWSSKALKADQACEAVSN
jgi:hypothetical protein